MIVGVLPAMGAVLGASTMVKELASAAPSILARPEARGKTPWIVRIEPKANPALCALIALADAARAGNVAAYDEWKRLAEAAGNTPVKRAMLEAVAFFKTPKVQAILGMSDYDMNLKFRNVMGALGDLQLELNVTAEKIDSMMSQSQQGVADPYASGGPNARGGPSGGPNAKKPSKAVVPQGVAPRKGDLTPRFR